jgi:methylmalonyl-CoA mutase N-terminal domain/subunit
VVGVNEFITGAPVTFDTLKLDPLVRARQVARLQQVRAERDNERVGSLLAQLRRDAEGGAPLMPTILDCVRAYATLGEICGVLRGVFGEYQPATLW